MTEKEVDIEESFRKLQFKLKKFKLSTKQLSEVKSLHLLDGPNVITSSFFRIFSKRYLFIASAIATVLVAVAIGVWKSEWPISNKALADFYFDEWWDVDIDSELCAIEMPDVVYEVTRPPTDCTICHGVTNIDKVNKITADIFEQKYAYTGRPVVILNATDNWTAPGVFNFQFFKELYNEDSPALENFEDNCQFFPYKTNFHNLSDVFKMSSEEAYMKGSNSKPWYIGWSNCDAAAANILREHYQKPYFLPGVSESSKTDWIFMGVPGYGAPIHIDNVGNPSWQAQITGEKKWIFEPPPECYLECARRFEVIVNPGEIIVADTNVWFHGTEVLGNEISIVIGSEFD
ncbi:unnamed protein product [Owenia fusiformis]|uniref:Cupin-like domain-containing protein n=1 Tax=Owenia fusiformis TaxID=6347 RepID=A0A8J1TW34_OWEFU|nr:unnamed protein product [Owenia fusiformis]